MEYSIITLLRNDKVVKGYDGELDGYIQGRHRNMLSLLLLKFYYMNGGMKMSLLPMMVKCPKCGKKFSYNPDVGKMMCPKCGAIYTPGAESNKKIVK